MEKILNTLDSDEFCKLVEGVAFKNAIKKIPKPLLQKSSEQLETEVKPTEMDYFIKNAFWNEVRRALLRSRKIEPEDVYGGICTYTHWFNNILNNPKKLAWMISPCSDVKNGVAELKHWLLHKIREVLSLSVTNADGSPNQAIIKEVIKCTEVVFKLNEVR